MPIVKKDPKPEKIQAVAELKEIIQGSTAVILTDYQGLDVKGLGRLRNRLRESGTGYKVVKNNLFALAAEDSPVFQLTEGLAGPTAMVYTADDPVEAAKALQEFAKGSKAAIKIKSGVIDGTMFNSEQITALASIPPKQQLYSMVVGGLQAPITGLVGTMQQLISQFVFTLQGVADKKQSA